MTAKRSGLVWQVALSVAIGVSALAPPAVAGNATYHGIAGATPDGRHYAVFSDGDVGIERCGLAKARPNAELGRPPREPYSLHDPARWIATAECKDSGGHLLSVARWKWHRAAPEIRALRPITWADSSASPPARIAVDPDTHVRRIEVLQNGTWYPVLADTASSVSEVTPELRYGMPGFTGTDPLFSRIGGFIRLEDRVIITFSRADYYALFIEDEPISMSEREVSDVNARFTRARTAALAHTRALREQYAARSGPFGARPTSEQVAKRRRADAAREALKRWEVTRVFGALGDADVGDALWLLAWIDVPTRRLEAMRLYLELRDREPARADAIVAELAAEPATAWLASYLQTRNDPLRGLPDVTGCSHTRLGDAALAGLKDEELLWLHRAQWAAQGCYRFSDPEVQEYFEQFTWYAPIPKDAWRVRSKKLSIDPDAPLLKKVGTSVPADACKENLETILRAERARGLSPPSL